MNVLNQSNLNLGGKVTTLSIVSRKQLTQREELASSEVTATTG